MRILVPRLIQNCIRTSRLVGNRAPNPRYGPYRNFYKPSWYLPSLVHRSPWHSPKSIFRDMDHSMRNMERFMDEVFAPSALRRPFVRTGKELQVTYNDKKFEVKLDISEYKPEDIEIKLTGDTLQIKGNFEETGDQQSFVKRSFERHFPIPENVEADTIESILTNDGHLVISGKVKGAEEIPERTINIKRDAAPKEKPADIVEE